MSMAMTGEEAQTSGLVEDEERQDFATLDGSLYYKVWYIFTMRESLAAMPEVPDNASPAEHRCFSQGRLVRC